MLGVTLEVTMRTIRTQSTREVFLRALAETGNVSASAEAAGIGRNALYQWRSDDLGFARAWDLALELGVDALEDEAKRRAMNGSDTLLMFLLRGRRPEVYGQKSQIAVINRHE